MEPSLIVFICGVVIFLVGGVWLLVLAFAESILWGMGSLLLWPATTIAFGIAHWSRARLPLMLHFAGLAIALGGGVAWGMDKMKGVMG